MSTERPVLCQMMLGAAILTLNAGGLYFVEDLAVYVFYRVTCTIYPCGTSFWILQSCTSKYILKIYKWNIKLVLIKYFFFLQNLLLSHLPAFVAKLYFCSLISEYYYCLWKLSEQNYIVAFLIKYFIQNYSLSPPVILSSVHTVPSCIIYPQCRKLSQCKSILCFLKRGHE